MDVDGNFDVVILGTGLTESITAAALSKAGFKVAHLDSNSYYGGDEATLSLDELAQWADRRRSTSDADQPSSRYLSAQRERFTSVTRSETIPDHARHYSISLAPALIPSLGPLISSLVASGVARYGGYRLLERVGIFQQGDRTSGGHDIKSVPGSKEDVFKSKDMSLLEKRRLMRFLMFASGEFEGKKEIEGREDKPFVSFLKEAFSLDGSVSEAIAYALAFCTTPNDPTLPALTRLRHYLRSTGRYGASPFLVGHYGGSGEIAQGFCRISAVNGGVYILDRALNSIFKVETSETEAERPTSNRYNIELNDFPEPMTAEIVISAPDHLPSELKNVAQTVYYEDSSSFSSSRSVHSVARGVAIIDFPIPFPAVAPVTSSSGDEGAVEGTEEDQATPAVPSPPEVERPVDTAVLVFPPSSLEGGSRDAAVHAFVTGEGSMSAPKGKYIAYLSLPLLQEEKDTVSPETLLRPYLDAVLALGTFSASASPPADSSTLVSDPNPETVPDNPRPSSGRKTPLFTLFYVQHPPSSLPPPVHSTAPTSLPGLSGATSASDITDATIAVKDSTVLTTPPLPPSLVESSDNASQAAEAMFFKAVEVLRARHPAGLKFDEDEDEAEGVGKVEKGDKQKGAAGDVFEEIKAFWPALDGVGEDEGEEW